MTADEIRIWGDSAMARLEKATKGYTAPACDPEFHLPPDPELIYTEGELEDVLNEL